MNIIAKCPKCEKEFKIFIEFRWTGNGIYRRYCRRCLWSVTAIRRRDNYSQELKISNTGLSKALGFRFY